MGVNEKTLQSVCEDLDVAITLLAEFAIANGERGPFHPSSWAGRLGPMIHAEIERIEADKTHFIQRSIKRLERR